MSRIVDGGSVGVVCGRLGRSLDEWDGGGWTRDGEFLAEAFVD